MIAVDGKTVSVRRIVYTQAKNELRLPIDMDIPLHPRPRADYRRDAAQGHMTFLVTEFGKPFAPGGLRHWFRDRCVEAAVPGRAHAYAKRRQ